MVLEGSFFLLSYTTIVVVDNPALLGALASLGISMIFFESCKIGSQIQNDENSQPNPH